MVIQYPLPQLRRDGGQRRAACKQPFKTPLITDNCQVFSWPSNHNLIETLLVHI